MSDLHSVGGSISVPEEPLASASAANAAVEKNVGADSEQAQKAKKLPQSVSPV